MKIYIHIFNNYFFLRKKKLVVKYNCLYNYYINNNK